MQIKEITRYQFNGKEYPRLLDVQKEVENQIGAIIDYSDVTLTPKQKLNLFKAITENKKLLTGLLNVEFLSENSGLHDKAQNILDMSL